MPPSSAPRDLGRHAGSNELNGVVEIGDDARPVRLATDEGDERCHGELTHVARLLRLDHVRVEPEHIVGRAVRGLGFAGHPVSRLRRPLPT